MKRPLTMVECGALGVAEVTHVMQAMLTAKTYCLHRCLRRSGPFFPWEGRLLTSFPRLYPYATYPLSSSRSSMVRHVLPQDGSYSDFLWPLALSTAAGLSTSIGGLIAVVRKPSQGTMAGLLGVAMGVMACVSVVELIARNAIENDAPLVCASALAGGLAYYILEPLFPKEPEEGLNFKKDSGAMPEIASSHIPLLNSLDGDSHTVLRKKPRKPGGFGATSATGVVAQQDSETHASGIGKGASSRQAWTITAPRSASGSLLHADSTGTLLASGERLKASQSYLQQAPSGVLAEQQEQHYADGITIVNGGDAGSRDKHGTGQAGTAGIHAVAEEAAQSNGHSGRGQMGESAGDSQAGGSAVVHHGSGEVSLHASWLMGGQAHTPHTANLLRLGLLMTITMTLHNMPEGFAVAFSAGTSLGPVMAMAIALHNIPEGVIIAAPIYAATNSRWKALGLATASGLSEPLGALLALLVLHPWITEERLQYMLAFVGGLMLAVCVIELWPEARACRNDRALAVGAVAGAAIMAWTLAVEG